MQRRQFMLASVAAGLPGFAAAADASKKIAAGASKANAKTVKRTKPTAPPKPPGRPSTYTAELAAQVCTHIADGKSLRVIAAMEGMPAQSTIMLFSELPMRQ